MENRELIVLYNGNKVGLLKELSNEKIGFQYEDSWINNGFSISPFSLPLSNRIYISSSPYFEGLFGVFYDFLPDGWGVRLLIRMLSKKGIDYLKLPALAKLSLISDNGLGALEFQPSKSIKTGIDGYSLDELAKEADSFLKEDDSNTKNFDTLYELGGSSGGARPKAHVRIDDEEWIVIFPAGIDGKNAGLDEYKANVFASKSGIRTTDFKLFESAICPGYYGSKRFDRINNKRVHTISLSSLLETSHQIPNLDYMHFFQVTKRICKDHNELYEAYKRMCFNVLYGNKDDHGKNFAYTYDESIKSYRLSPFYDITKTPYKVEHEMTVLGNGKPNEKDLVDIIGEAELNRDRCLEIIRNTKDAIKQ